MRSFAIPLIALAFVVSAAGAAPAVHAACRSNFNCLDVNSLYGSDKVCVNGECVSPTPAGDSTNRYSLQAGENPGSGSKVKLLNPLKGGGDIESFLLNILDFVIRIGAVVVILMLVFVGFKFVTAQGEPGKITEARAMLLWTVVGALVLLGSQAIALAIKATVSALSTGG